MWNETTSPAFLVMVAASILAHVAVIAALSPGDEAPREVKAPPILIAIEAAPPIPVPPIPPVKELPQTAARPLALARSPRPPAQRLATRAVATASEPTTEAADFSGVTLTNEGAGWSSPTGDGTPITGPVGPAARETSRPSRATTGGGTGDRVVAVGDLSRRPRAPNLDAQLAANYPREARASGTGGTAVIRARILVDGRVGATRVVSESAPGFGTACQRTLAGSRWQAPLDKDHQAVATDLAYTCTFAVAR